MYNYIQLIGNCVIIPHMRVGKLLNEELIAEVLSKISHFRSEVKVGAGVGEDCASIKTEDLILISTDPITAEVEDIGSLAISVATNDIYASGGLPMAVSITILMPTTGTPQQVGQIMDSASAKAKALNAEIIGGHTEFTDAVIRPVVTVTALGIANKHIQSTALTVGDSIVITKQIALEGTAILATQYQAELQTILTQQELAEAKSLANSTSIGQEARLAVDCKVRTMHDITEGGIFGALAELCDSSDVGAEIYTNSIPKLGVSEKICNQLGIDIYGLISSGSLLITTPNPTELINTYNQHGLQATVVGKVVTEKGAYAITANGKQKLAVARDELFKLLEK